jgi:hypothetical protein
MRSQLNGVPNDLGFECLSIRGYKHLGRPTNGGKEPGKGASKIHLADPDGMILKQFFGP